MVNPYSLRVAIVAAALTASSSGWAAGKSGPREIVIEAPSSSPTSPGSASNNKAAVASADDETRAQDNALIAGAVDIDAPVHMTRSTKRVEHEFLVKGGRCYVVSAAWKGQFRAALTYVFGRSNDNRPVNDFYTSDSGTSYPGEGVAQFCADRSGPVRLELTADDAVADAMRDYTVVIGSRTETAAQRDARRRRAATTKAAADKAREGEKKAAEKKASTDKATIEKAVEK